MKKALSLLITILLIFGLTACGKKTETKEPTAEPAVEYALGLREDEHTIIWETGTVTHVYKHDGTKITGYTEYLDAIDAETAEATVAEACENGKPVDKEYKSVTAKEQYVIVEFNDEYIPLTEYSEVVSQAESAHSIALQDSATEDTAQ